MRWAVLCFGLIAASRAHAAAGESALSFSPGFGSFSVRQGNMDLTGIGGTATVDFTYGVAEAFWLRAAVSGGLYSAEDDLTTGGSATVGVYYAVDILKYVPYVTASVGGFLASGGAIDTKVHAILELGAGVEILEGRSFSWGIEARLASFASQATLFTIGPRISLKFGYF